MITDLDFMGSLGFLSEMLPMQRAMSQEALLMAWETFPETAKQQLTPESLFFAVCQRLLDPAPPKDVALHIAILRYVYPIERTIKHERGQDANEDRVMLESGPRSDLDNRMANPDCFHDISPRRHDSAPPVIEHSKRLTAGDTSRRSCIAAVEAIIRAGHDGLSFSGEQLFIGKNGFNDVLRGGRLLDIANKKDCVNGWIVRNPDEALKLAREANVTMSMAVPIIPGGSESILSEFV